MKDVLHCMPVVGRRLLRPGTHFGFSAVRRGSMCSKELLNPKQLLYNVVVPGREMSRLDVPAGDSILCHEVETASQRTRTNQGGHGSLRSM